MKFSEYQQLRFERRDHGVLLITMDRPDKYNAADEQMHSELARVWAEVSADPQTRVAVITGAASGIGRAAAQVFTRAGARVVLADRNEAGLAETAMMVGGSAIVQPMDVSRRADVDRVAHDAMESLGRIDVWANVAGATAPCSISCRPAF